MKEQQVLIGLEIHVALATQSKMFCGCSTAFGGRPNSQVCPVCLGLPGSLPVLNRRAVELGLAAALALEAEIYPRMQFERKNYHYPDLPKGYQISQYAAPMAERGRMVFTSAGGEDKAVRIRRVHLEEDAGKSIHAAGGTLLDFNRCGVPLVEIVTEPDLHAPESTRAFLEQLRELLHRVGVSEVRMEEGELRCDVNINVVGPRGRTEITEVKNLSSFRGVERALRYEVARHREAVAAGDSLYHETRHWDEDRQVTIPARTKEESHDYRYFPDPDLPGVTVGQAWVRKIASRIPETPRHRRQRLQREYGLSSYDAAVLVRDGQLADFFEETVSHGADPKEVANWAMGEVSAYLNARGVTLEDLPAAPEDLARLLQMIASGKISGKIAKEVWLAMAGEGGDPEEIVSERGLSQISDDSVLEELAEKVIGQNPDVVRDYLGGKEKAVGFLVGQIMKETRGKANPQLVNEKLRDSLEQLRERESDANSGPE
ncbi:MAG: Asp-tRNA(Asn)/Glu-tRNA(Gln) amidotransferase subunit GatB [Bacillota bacterium]